MTGANSRAGNSSVNDGSGTEGCCNMSLRKHAHAIYSDFSRCKNDNFQLKLFYFFHIFAQNIYCGCTLEPAH